MMRRVKFLAVLELLQYVGIFLLVIMFIRFNTQISKTTINTNKVLKSQSDILHAIKQLSYDNKITSEQKTNIIICMLQVPISQRNANILDSCRKQAADTNGPAVLVPKVDSPSTTPTSSSTTATPPAKTPNLSQSQTQSQTTPKPDNNGIILNIPGLPQIHIPSPL